MAGRIAFELVSPERLLVSAEVEMVVVPGGDGNFGVLRGHAPLISTVRPGLIDVYETRPTRSDRIFVAGGFAEVTAERCTVLAEEAVPLAELDRGRVDQEVKDLASELSQAATPEARQAVQRRLDVAEAKRTALLRG